ncbi:MAG: hypothetical protein ACK4IK_06360 [Bacteroidia bacterium]
MKTLFAVLLFTFSLNAFCQDTIMTKNLQTFIGKVYEIDRTNKEIKILTNKGNSAIIPFDRVKTLSVDLANRVNNKQPEIKKTESQITEKQKESPEQVLTNEQKLEILRQEILNMQVNLNDYYVDRRDARMWSYAALGGGLLSSVIIGVGAAEGEESILFVGGTLSFFSALTGIISYVKFVEAEKNLKNASISPNGIKFKF